MATTTEYLNHTQTLENGSYTTFSMSVALHMLGRSDECTEAVRKCLAIAEKSSNWDTWAATG